MGSGGAAGSATANLSAAYQNLVNEAGAGTAASAVSTGVSAAQSGTQSGATGLQSFLGNLLQNLQAGGVHALSSIGNNVNANV